MEINSTIARIVFLSLIVVSIILLIYMYYSGMFTKTEDKELDKIKKYIINTDVIDPNLSKLDKPILWIHNDYKVNDRNWPSFGSRNTRELNKPLIYVTIDTIVKECGKSFYICLIDDNSFNNLIPNWPHNLDQIPNPVKDHYRFIAMMRLLYLYGGMNIPASFLCFKNLINLYNDGIKNNRFFIGESISHDSEADVFVNKDIIGCKKDNGIFMEYLETIEEVLYKDYTNEPEFLNKINKIFLDGVDSHEINVINGEYLGLYDSKRELITMQIMLGDYDVEMNNKAYGIFIPIEDIINRLHYEWFSKLTVNEIAESNTYIGHIIRKIYCDDKRINKLKK